MENIWLYLDSVTIPITPSGISLLDMLFCFLFLDKIFLLVTYWTSVDMGGDD